MTSLLEHDVWLLRLINGAGAPGILDAFFVFITDSGRTILPLGIVAAIIWWRGNAQTRYFLFLTLLAMGLSDLIGGTLKELVARPRTYWMIEGLRQIPGGPNFTSTSGSFPSNHAANNFALATMLSVCFRHRWVAIGSFFFATLVAFSRIHVGVHYPSDVFGGALIGVASAGVLYLYHRLRPLVRIAEGRFTAFDWLSMGLLVFAGLWLYRVGIVMKGHIPLAAEEAQYWAWSRQLDWSYYSKPGGIAFLISIGTALFGHTEIGVRSVALASALGMGLATLVLTRRMFSDDRVAGVSLIALNLVPIYAIGAIITTTDAPLILFWSLACLAAWLAIFEELEEGWLLLGMTMALGLFIKYAMIYFMPCLLIYLLLSGVHRRLLRTAGPWLAIGVGLLGFIPTLYWNSQHEWVNFRHVGAQTVGEKGFGIDIGSFLEYLVGQPLIVGPGVFAMIVLASLPLLRRNTRSTMDPRTLFLLSLGLPVLAALMIRSFTGKVLGNWAAPAYYTLTIAGAAALVALWDRLAVHPSRRRAVQALAAAGALVPLVAMLVFYEPSGYQAIFEAADKGGIKLPPSANPRYQFSGGPKLGKTLDATLASMPDPKRTFVFAKRYQEASLAQFYMKDQRRTYNVNTGRRMNQFDIWGGFEEQKGMDAIYVIQGEGDLQLGNEIVRGAFLHVGPPTHIKVKTRGKDSERGQQLTEYTLYPCFGFRGHFAEPPVRRY